jgi:octaprenyl-diphosphate synthase
MDTRAPVLQDPLAGPRAGVAPPAVGTGNGLFGLIGSELDAVEAYLGAVAGAKPGLLTTVTNYGLASGGKRIRPALVLLAAQACGQGRDRRAVRLAAVAEMMHAATLIHDDIVDHSSTRRGVPSAMARWGSQVAVLVGDFLYARAIQIVVEDSDLRVMRAFADATVAMTEAEILQLELLHDLGIGEADYLRIVTGKTAALLAASCRVGGLAAGAPPAQLEALAAFGLQLGIAFQLVDDALDYVAREERLGKPVGSDFREGKITYPLIHVLRVASAEDRARLEALAEQPTLDPDHLGLLRSLVDRYAAVTATRGLVTEYLERACGHLLLLPDTPARRALHRLAEFVGARDR